MDVSHILASFLAFFIACAPAGAATIGRNSGSNTGGQQGISLGNTVANSGGAVSPLPSVSLISAAASALPSLEPLAARRLGADVPLPAALEPAANVDVEKPLTSAALPERSAKPLLPTQDTLVKDRAAQALGPDGRGDNLPTFYDGLKPVPRAPDLLDATRLPEPATLAPRLSPRAPALSGPRPTPSWAKAPARQAPAPVSRARVFLRQARLAFNLLLQGLWPARPVVQTTVVDSNRPTVALVLAPTLKNLSLLREAHRQSPGDMHLVLDPAWTEEGSHRGEPRLFLKKGLVFDGEKFKITEYRTPRLIHYWADAVPASGIPAARAAELLTAARRDALKGKHMLMIWPNYQNYPEKYSILAMAKSLGVKVVVLDDPSSKAKEWGAGLISADIRNDWEGSYSRTLETIQVYIAKHGAFDGIVNFWEDDVPMTARLARDLGLAYHSVEAAGNARSKLRTRQIMEKAGLPTPKFRKVTSRAELEEALTESWGYPLILKPAFGVEGMAVIKVYSAAEARAAYEKIVVEIDPSRDPIFSHGLDVVLEEYLDGEEVDIDVAVQRGRFPYESITGNWPTDEPYFIPKGVTEPSDLPAHKQRAMIQLARAAALALGFRDGVLHIEGKYTSHGPRLLEVNARMGGYWVRKFKKEAWGVDLAEVELMIRAGIPVAPYKPERPLAYLEAEFFVPPQTGTFEGIEGAETAKASRGFLDLFVFKKPGEKIFRPPEAYDRLFMLSSRGATPEEAKNALAEMRPLLRVEIKP